jgi:RNA polymerase sigma-70 factor (ECF subfamily)
MPRVSNDVPIPLDPADHVLMQRLGGGDMQALAVLVQRYQKPVRILAYRFLGKWDQADDVAQDAFLRLCRSADRYQPDTALMALLRRIVVNLCLDLRKRKRAGALPEWDPPAGTHWSADGRLEQDEKRLAVWKEIADLPERQRIALTLHRFEGLGHEEIAALTGWSPSAIESLLVRAYTRLRERLSSWA